MGWNAFTSILTPENVPYGKKGLLLVTNGCLTAGLPGVAVLGCWFQIVFSYQYQLRPLKFYFIQYAASDGKVREVYNLITVTLRRAATW